MSGDTKRSLHCRQRDCIRFRTQVENITFAAGTIRQEIQMLETYHAQLLTVLDRLGVEQARFAELR